ncbi:hypothetical protein MESS2_1000030 [Mesorhizobium metallidurans STM 2683]|uniref:Uncharacterized protein n=1 Tax=Mesorhizobium metallidurans STM 2683 TaxID=1297569 RepID=M5ETK6_9HYPH|nr:hypothetical protein MESS2_1000030 [Mesorhizobium metallidurans STM 2683]
MTVVLIRRRCGLLSRDMSYEVPEQDLQLDLSRISQKTALLLLTSGRQRAPPLGLAGHIGSQRLGIRE